MEKSRGELEKELPGALPLPVPDITVNTRKGVYVSYQPDMRAG